MTTTEIDPAEIEAQVGAYAERLFGTGLACAEAMTIMLGRQLDLYRPLAVAEGVTPAELAAAAGINARYAREWLEQQAVAGWVETDDEAVEDADARRYRLSLAGEECLLRPDSLASVGPLFDFIATVPTILPALLDAFRTGGGVPYAAYGVHDAQGDFNRPAFAHLLTSEWLPAIPGLVARLAAGPPASVAEIGCGEGWAAIAIAKAWPGVRVDGFDLDEASVAVARRHAAEAGVADRVHFEVADVADPTLAGSSAAPYDLVCAFEMVHDLAQPQAALATMGRLAAPGACVLVMDEKAGETFEAPSESPYERLFYAASVLHCLPVGMADGPGAETGTVMRPATLRRYAAEAGFDHVDVLPVEHDMFRFYQLFPR